MPALSRGADKLHVTSSSWLLVVTATTPCQSYSSLIQSVVSLYCNCRSFCNVVILTFWFDRRKRYIRYLPLTPFSLRWRCRSGFKWSLSPTLNGEHWLALWWDFIKPLLCLKPFMLPARPNATHCEVDHWLNKCSFVIGLSRVISKLRKMRCFISLVLMGNSL